jgi:hypothetical protein
MTGRNVALVGEYADLLVVRDRNGWMMDILCGICLMFWTEGNAGAG